MSINEKSTAIKGCAFLFYRIMLDFLYTKWRMSTTITLRKVLVIMDSQYKDNQFCITVEYEKLESNPEQIFLGIAKLIEGLQYADK